MDVVPLDEPHVDVEHTVDLAEVVHLDDVRFLKSRSDPRLASEPLLEAGVSRHFGTQQFDRYCPILGGVVGAIHLAHPADTQQRLQLVRAEHRADP
jgi:hypothetical protein